MTRLGLSALRTLLCILVIAFAANALGQGSSRGNHGAIVSAQADQRGRVHLRFEDSVERVITPRRGQVGIDGLTVSPDGSAAAWLVESPNCCTSYPVSTELRIYTKEGVLRHLGDGQAISDWHFTSDGTQIAFFTDTVHSNLSPQCWLFNVRTGREDGRWKRGDGRLPSWAEGFADEIGPLEAS